jgi:syntaxin 12/13
MSNYTSLGDGPRSNYPSSTSSSSSSSSNSNVADLLAELTNGIESLTKSNNKLERAQMKIGTPADNVDFREKFQEDQHNLTHLVKNLISTMKEVNTQLAKSSSPAQLRQQRAQLTRLSTNFDREYKRYQRLQSQSDEKMKDVMKAATTSSSTKASSSRLSGTTGNNYGSDARSSPLLQQEQAQAMEDQIQFLEYDYEEIQRRTRDIRLIESEVADVAEMYRDMHILVHEQQEGIDMIENNIMSTKERTENASEQLVSAEGYQRKARKKQCCVVVILLVIIAVVVTVVMIVK